MTPIQQTPRELGFSMPAEWEKHEATWLAWPHNTTDWPGKMGAIQWVFAEIVRKLAAGEKVRILLDLHVHKKRVRSILERANADLSNVEFFCVPTDRSWMRDSGPLFVKSRRDGAKAIVHFHFNGWARYPDWHKDRRVPEELSGELGIQLLDAQANGRPFVLEGGSIDVNGEGSLITTEECLLDPRVQTRNPGLGREEVEEALKTWLGVTNVLWLGKGVAGDDTHGHVDDFCRFVGPRTLVLCEEKNSKDPNHRVLEENCERLRGMRLEDGSKPEIVRLPMPSPLLFGRERLPASYANFYISNAAVLVPTFNDPRDREALGILSELFGDRPVVGIHSGDLVLGQGTLHCLTQQEP